MQPGLHEVIITVNNRIEMVAPGAKHRWPAFMAQVRKDMEVPNPERMTATRYRRYVRNIPEKIVLWEYDRKTGALYLPRGYTLRIMELMREHQVPYRMEDTRTYLPPENFGSRIALRDYQVPAVEDLVTKATQGILQAPAGSGKTQMGLEVIARIGQPALWLTHTRDLAQQVLDRAAEVLDIPRREIGMLGAGRESVGDRLTIGIIQKMARMDLSELAGSFGTVLLDECFPAGTMIDGKPIESISIGDMVSAWHCGQVVSGRVTTLFKRPVGNLMVRIIAGKQVVVSTPTHPFLTKRGWVPAFQLTKEDELLYAEPERALSPVREDKVSMETGALPEMPERSTKESQESPCNLYPVYKAGCSYGKGQNRSVSEIGADLLFGGVQENLPSSLEFRNNGEDKQKICLRTDEAKEPHAEPRNPGPGQCCTQGQGMEAACSGREWPGTYCPTEDNGQSTELAGGSCDSDEDAQGDRVPDLLQGGYWQSGPENWGGVGRQFPLREESGGQQKGGVINWVRVDHIEVLEPGSDGTFGGLCTDGYVYNFEVEECHTYTANGFVVHNCHHSPALTWAAVINQLPARYRYGVTATFDRADGLEVITSLVIGPTLHVVDRGRVEEAGGVVRPDVRPVLTSCESEAWVKYKELSKDYEERLKAGKTKKHERPPVIPFGDILADVLDSFQRNGMIIDLLARECPGHCSLVLSERVAHCQELKAMLEFRCPQLRTGVIHGKLGKTARREILAAMNSGELDVLFAVDIAKEGLDIPRLDRLFLVAGGRNPAEVEQKVGRVQRSFPGKADAVVFDFVDEKVGVLKAQHWARRKVYQSLGLQIVS